MARNLLAVWCRKMGTLFSAFITKCCGVVEIQMIANSVILFAKNNEDRDYLRGHLNGWGHPLLFFDRPTICFDNLRSVHPKIIVIKTNCYELVWQFVFALKALKIETVLLIVTNRLNQSNFRIAGAQNIIFFQPVGNQSNGLVDQLEHLIANDIPPTKRFGGVPMIGAVPAIKRINESIPGLKNALDSVLISGEKGTGKELLARQIVGDEAGGSIVIKVNCSCFSSEKIGLLQRDEIRRGGSMCLEGKRQNSLNSRLSIIFDKIDLLSKDGQAEVLSLLENGLSAAVDAAPSLRIVATAEADLEDLVKQNHFRPDLYYRLNVIALSLPPLRQRREDIPLLADYFAIKACAQHQRSFLLISPQTREKMYSYHWPGNIDQFKRAIDRFSLSGDETQITAQMGMPAPDENKHHPDLVPFEIFGAPDSFEIQNHLSEIGSVSLKSICDDFVCQTEKRILQKALETTNWNRRKAAALLKISYKSILNKIKTYNII